MYRARLPFALALLLAAHPLWNHASAEDTVRLTVPVARQDGSAVCGPASLEMVLRYFGETRHDQFQLAYDIAATYSGERRYRDSDYLTENGVRWLRYPGTPAYLLNRYLKQFGEVDYFYRKAPPDGRERAAAREQAWGRLVSHLKQGRPVLIMQYWKRGDENTHYRVVTGYASGGSRILLNDPRFGPISQSRAEFFHLWEIAELNLSYTMLALAPRARPMRVDLQHSLPAQYRGILYASDLEEFYTGANQFFDFSHQKDGYRVRQLKAQRWDYARVSFSFDAYKRLRVGVRVRLDPARLDGPKVQGFCGLQLGDGDAKNFNVFGLGQDGRAVWWTRRKGEWKERKTLPAVSELAGRRVGSAHLEIRIAPSRWILVQDGRQLIVAGRELNGPSGLEKVGILCKNSGATFRDFTIRRD